MPISKPKSPAFELTIFGASSFVGQIICRHLVERAPNLRLVLAGRSKEKLSALQKELRTLAPNSKSEVIVADVNRPASMKLVAEQSSVVLSTVGPYALFGEPMVKACVEAGARYCDLTGEPQWIRAMIDRYQLAAEQSGAVLLPASGFDSVPSDIGVFLLQRKAIQASGAALASISMRVAAIKGGASGGTLASVFNVFKEASESKALRSELVDLYSLCNDFKPQKTRQRVHLGPGFDSTMRAWTAPFVMAAINTRVVLRSNALLGFRYGEKFKYDEAVLTGKGILGGGKAISMAAGLAAFAAASSIGFSRKLIAQRLPQPGEGPTLEQQARGFYRLEFYGVDCNGIEHRLTWKGDRDPGYGSTAKIISEVALQLLQDEGGRAKPGFQTPASCFGAALADALQSHAGIDIE